MISSSDGNTFVRRVVAHRADWDEPVGQSPPTYGNIFGSRGGVATKSRPPKAQKTQVYSVVSVPTIVKPLKQGCPKILALHERIKVKHGYFLLNGKPIRGSPVR